ncbi:MAG: EAL domain-containing protein [Halomonas sp.]|uniref:EAL domain-containing protein n=1 Tax=Halomonas sp. TaxID=1486246 RepID=UPI002ACE9506|nr:EAL domain-containing protein [Halomonas sp.]MDZ7851650.1 EAL domain-containing protein [Halomonas sp.]
MKLIHLSVASIIGCLLGLAVLIGITLSGLDEIRVKQEQVADLLDLKAREDDFSVASDRLLLFGADAELLADYRREGEALQQHLRQVGAESTAERKAVDRVEALLDRVTAEVEQSADTSATAPETSRGALDIPTRSRIVMNQVAELGGAVDSALDALLRERQRAIASDAMWIGGSLAGAAVLFGILSVIAFLLIHRRVAVPARALAHTLNAIRAGDADARAPVHGDDELADLAMTLNQTLDERQALDARLREQNRRLHQFHDLLEGSDDLCAILDSDYRYIWINRAYQNRFSLEEDIEGRTLPDIVGERLFREQIRPRLDRCLAGEPQRFELEREFKGIGTRRLLARQYPIDLPGRASERRVAVVITDITDIHSAKADLVRHANLLELAGRVARFGGWSVNLVSGRCEWSNVVAEIHGKPHGYAPPVGDGMAFYAPEYRERIRELFTACAEQGVPFDDELQIIDAQGQRLWVRALGEPVRDEQGNIVQVQGAFQDVTSRRESEKRLRKLAHIVDQSPAAVAVTDLQGHIEYVNPAFEAVSGYPREELLGDTPARIKSGNTPEAVYRELWETITAGQVWAGELLNRRKDGSLYWESEVISPLTDERGEITNYVAIKQDITALKEAEQALRASRDELASLLDARKALINSLPAHIALLDADGKIIDVNEQWRHFGEENAYAGDDFGLGVDYIGLCEAASGDCADEASEMAAGLRDVLAGEQEVFALEYPCHSPEQFRWFRVMANRLVPGEENSAHHGAVVMHINITERKLAEQELSRIAFEDPLTGLYSRNGFTRQLQQHIAQHGWQAPGLVVVIDIVGLRDVNDAFGYEVGDRLLVEMGRRFREQAGAHGLAGRIGSDEFTLFLLPERGEALETHLSRLIEFLSAPFELDGSNIEISIRLGHTRLGDQRRPAENLLREAELALFRHRAESSMPWVAFSNRLQEESQQRIELTRDLRRALNEDQFELHFQPKVALASGTLVACEALLRWYHPERGLISPGVFIPIAEQSQLIAPIGDWVLRRACQHLRDWRDAGLEPVRVAVNVSLVQFQKNDFPSRVRAVLDQFGVAPEELSLEITESVFERESELLLTQMRTLREMGVRLSLDDFGTGYSSLLYLQRYPFDEIKIDQGFVFHLLDDPLSRHIVETVVMLARALDAEVVAEGIESAAVSDELMAMGCRFGQGYFYSMPLEAEDFRWLLEQRSPLPLTDDGAATRL